MHGGKRKVPVPLDGLRKLTERPGKHEGRPAAPELDVHEFQRCEDRVVDPERNAHEGVATACYVVGVRLQCVIDRLNNLLI